MKKLFNLALIGLGAVLLALPMVAHALEKQPQIQSTVVMKVGNKVNLFHSGTEDVKKEVCLNDVIPVYRELMAGGHTTTKEVGKVKVLSYAGEHYFEAEVVEGEIQTGDLAKKKTAGCLIQQIP